MSRVGVVLIHGIFGSPKEFDDLAHTLKQAGYQTHQITLPGHGARPLYALSQVTTETLVSHCLAEYEQFATTCDEVVVVGHSLGGLCTLMLAAHQPTKLRGILTFSTPCEKAYFINYPQGYRTLSMPQLLKGLHYAPQSYTNFEKPDFKLWWFPYLKEQTEWMFLQLRWALSQIQVPVYLAHSVYDMAIPYGEMNKLADGLSQSPLVTSHTLKRCGHQIFAYSREKSQSTQLVFQFLERHCHQPACKVAC